MGKRSRKHRPSATHRAASAAEPQRPQRPRPPWHPVPLVELCVLLGLVLIVIGLFSLKDQRGGILILCGLALGSLAGLDTVLREHFAGSKSHSTLLAGVPAVVLAGLLYFARAPWILLVAAVVAVFATAFMVFRGAFMRRSGGVGFR
jgi:hypothetical protein